MNSKLGQPLLSLEKIESLVQLEPALVLLGLSLFAWLGYKLLLRKASEERHRNLSRLFKNLALHVTFGNTLFVLYYALHSLSLRIDNTAYERLASYVGFFTLLSGMVIFVKVSRIYLFEYLFLSHMRVAVPLLLVNLFTLLLSIVLGGWLCTEIFAIKLAPLIATSAVFSLVLGLALQDTLGNLFAGVALQFDKPYEIGDWIEIQALPQKWVGQVQEISWRATVLLSMTEESITIPNRLIAQSEVSNFSTRVRPIIRSQGFRIPYEVDPNRAKPVFAQALHAIEGIRNNPAPLFLVTESADSWYLLKVIYFLDDYGTQFIVGDRVITACLKALHAAKIDLATPKLKVLKVSDHASA